MNKILFLLIVLIISACVESDWRRAPLDYSCTDEQMVIVESQANFCKKHTEYLVSYCYGTAIMRNCTKFKVKP